MEWGRQLACSILRLLANLCGSHQLRIKATEDVELHHGLGDDKMHRYCELPRDVFTDQLAWLRDRKRGLRITKRNGRASLAMAAAATAMAN